MSKFELSSKQKEYILNYIMVDSKGLFEDCNELWEGMTEEEFEENYSSIKEAVYKFIDEARQTLINMIEYHGRRINTSGG